MPSGPRAHTRSFGHPHSWPEALSVDHTPGHGARVSSALTPSGDPPVPMPQALALRVRAPPRKRLLSAQKHLPEVPVSGSVIIPVIPQFVPVLHQNLYLITELAREPAPVVLNGSLPSHF